MKMFKCSMCGLEFEGGWSDEKANKESEEIFGVKDASTNEGMDVICDDCWQKVKPKGR